MAKKPKTKQFKYKVLFIFALISLLPLLVMASFNLWSVFKTSQQSIVEQEDLALENAKEKVNSFFNDKATGFRLAISGSYNSLYHIPVEDLLFLIVQPYTTGKPHSIEYIDRGGQIILQVDESGVFSYSKEYLELFNTGLEELPYNIEGRIVHRDAVKKLSRVEADVSESPDFIETVKYNEFNGVQQIYFGPLEFSEQTPVMRIATVITNQNNDVIGAVSALIHLTELNEIISSIKLGESGYVYITDNNGMLITSGGSDFFAQPAESLSDIPGVKAILGEEIDDIDFNFYTNPQNIDVVFAGKDMKVVNWYIFSEWPYDDAFSITRQIRKVSVYLSLGTLVFVILVGLYFARKITYPISVLSKGAKEISKGNLDHEIEMETNDEFQLLSDQFNKMIVVLKENQKLRDEFVFIAAHELRTPVTAIKGYMSMLIDGTFGPVTPTIKENLDIVNSSNERLVQLVNDLLEIARSDAGKMKIDMQPIGIGANVKQVMNKLKSLSDKKGIKVNYMNPRLT